MSVTKAAAAITDAVEAIFHINFDINENEILDDRQELKRKWKNLNLFPYAIFRPTCWIHFTNLKRPFNFYKFN